MKTTGCKIVAREGNLIVKFKNNPEFGSIMFVQTSRGLNSRGFMQSSNRVAFMPGKVEDLEAYVSEENLKDGDLVPDFKIIRNESYEPFYDGQNPVVNVNTGETMLKNGKEYYFQDTLVANVDTYQDHLLGNTITENVPF